jgi:molecular chaperone GrpE (heat shock protein)
MTSNQTELEISLLEGVKQIDEFRAAVDASENGTDVDAAWELIDSMRETLTKALKSLGIEAAPYAPEQPPVPGPR